MDLLLALSSVLSDSAGLAALLVVGLLGMAWLTSDDLIKNLVALGVLDSAGNVNIRRTVAAAAASQAVTALANGTIYVGAVDAVFTLPKSVVGRSLQFTFITGVASAGVGLRVAPFLGDVISGAGFTAVASEAAQNSGATDVIGDQIVVTENGLGTGWVATNRIGTWAKAA